MILEIIQNPNPILRAKNAKVKDPLDPEIQNLIFDMIETMRQAEGVGLAASQVGVNLRLCVVEVEENLLVLINPQITARSKERTISEEGCLSFPGKFFPIARSSEVQVRYLDQTDKPKKIRTTGLLARALQHEIDHLDGILFVDHIRKITPQGTARLKTVLPATPPEETVNLPTNVHFKKPLKTQLKSPLKKLRPSIVQASIEVPTEAPIETPVEIIPEFSAKKKQPELRVVFMGTSELSAKILEVLLAEHYNLVGVFTKADKKIGREQTLTAPTVKLLAEKNNLPVFQPSTFRNAQAVAQLQELKPDLIIVAAFGKILPKNVLEIPAFGCLNVHVSLLPKYRGPSPVQNALLCGETETGTTIMLMDEGVDTGDVLAQEKLPIKDADNTATLMSKLADQGAELLLKTLPLWIEKKIQPSKQDQTRASLCQLIEREDGHLSWVGDSAETIFNRYRALTPWPGIFSFYKNNAGVIRIKLLEIELQKENPQIIKKYGEVFETANGIGVQTTDGVILIKQLQQEGKKAADITAFLNGHPNFIGKILF
ncbi:MAG: methionyl-tRNA formyltransferase [Candidatus Moraniibacteriota bacterium]